MPRRLPRTAKPIPDAKESREALRDVIGYPHHRDFVWTGAVRLTDGTRIDSFLHSWTGRGVLIGDDRVVFRQTPTGRYTPDEAEWRLLRVIPHRVEWLAMGGYDPNDEFAPPLIGEDLEP